MNKLRLSTIICALWALALLSTHLHNPPTQAQNQRPQNQAPVLPATLDLDQGYDEFETPDFKLKLVKASQTVAALQPKLGKGFDFTPADLLGKRAANGFHHLGDLTLRVRASSSEAWKDYDTAAERKPVLPLSASGQTLAAADLTPTLPADSPIQITRSWALDNGRLVLRFELKNKGPLPVQIGSLGIPVVFNNMITGRNLEQAHEICSFSDPYIGLDGGYLQVTRLSGHGPSLVVVPESETPFEAYQLLNEPMRPNQTFERLPGWSTLRRMLRTIGRRRSRGTHQRRLRSRPEPLKLTDSSFCWLTKFEISREP